MDTKATEKAARGWHEIKHAKANGYAASMMDHGRGVSETEVLSPSKGDLPDELAMLRHDVRLVGLRRVRWAGFRPRLAQRRDVWMAPLRSTDGRFGWHFC